MKKALVVLAPLVLAWGYVQAQTQTPGKIVKFDPNLADTDSVISEDSNGNIGVGTMTPAAKLDVAGGNVNVQNSTATAGNVLKGGDLFLHNFGTNNTFLGSNAGNLTMSGDTNTGIGVRSLRSNTTGTFNTAVGNNSLQNSTSGYSNTATGAQALLNNIDGSNNTANGVNALYSNSSGSSNTAVGALALDLNTLGNYNTASGVNALQSNTTGSRNTATGWGALQLNNSGNDNTAIGSRALAQNASGDNNTAVGTSALALSNGSFNVAIGAFALASHTFGDDNIAIGLNAGLYLPNGYTNIYIGNPGSASPESNTIRIGRPIGHNRFFAAGVSGVPVQGAQVFVDSSGQLGVASSSKRFKEEVRDMGESTSRLRQLRPVSFYYKQEKQAEAGAPRPLQYGLIAEEVAVVYPELVEYSDNDEPFSVRYHLLAPMLLNEVQHQYRELERQRHQIDEQAKQIAELKAQAAQITELVRASDKRMGCGDQSL